ncbi:dethiobiotin synthase [Nitrospiraceae bacterium AH_259_D15_M11_P09]|nr:dethiobiotin synthase [Nitrospiraceae bacterium AH_259_D15_M11_P09]
MSKFPSGCFVAGTDTGVGKTVVTAALSLRLCRQGVRVGVMKPIETGLNAGHSAHSDAMRLRASACVSDPLDAISPYRLPLPLAPMDAARHAGETLDVDRILAAFGDLASRHSFMLVEGAGGILVPIARGVSFRDLIIRLGLPTIIVGRLTLGGINHGLLTIEALQQHGIVVRGIVLNQISQAQNSSVPQMQRESCFQLLRELSGVPVIGPLPHEPLLNENWEQGVERVAESQALSELADLIKADAF